MSETIATDPVPDNARPARFRVPLWAQVLVGVIVGAALGSTFGTRPYLFGLTNQHLGELGMLVIRLLKALAGPLILFAILDAFVRIGVTGRRFARLVLICLLNVSVALTIGLVLLNTMRPGLAWRDNLGRLSAAAEASRAGGKPKPPPARLTPMELVATYVPETLVEPLAKNNVLSIVILGILGGAALRRVRDRQLAEGRTSILPVEKFIEGGYEIIVQMLHWVVAAVPYAVLGAVAMVVGQSGLEVFRLLWVFLAAMIAGLAVHSLVYYPLSAWLLGGKSPRVFFGGGADAIITGLSTNSSLATVPVTLRSLTTKMGVSDGSARLSACVGTNFNNDGITLYEAMAALFLAQAAGLPLGLTQQAGVVGASILATLGIAGIPEAGFIILPLVLSAAGLSEATITVALGLIMPVDWIIARCRSAVNVMGDMQVAILLDRQASPSP